MLKELHVKNKYYKYYKCEILYYRCVNASLIYKNFLIESISYELYFLLIFAPNCYFAVGDLGFLRGLKKSVISD